MDIQKFKINLSMEKTEHFVFLRKENHVYLSYQEHKKIVDCFESFIDWVKFEISPERNGYMETKEKMDEISKYLSLIPKWQQLIEIYLKQWEYEAFFDCFENNLFEIKNCFYDTSQELMENEINLIDEFLEYIRNVDKNYVHFHKLDSGFFFGKFFDESRKFCKSCAPKDKTGLKNYCESMENIGNCKYKIFNDSIQYEKCFPDYYEEIQKSDYPLKRKFK